MKITIDVSDKNEATSSPWWVIIDPEAIQIRRDIDSIASAITGPFFSRKEALDRLTDYQYRYSAKAVVYCMSGHETEQYHSKFKQAVILPCLFCGKSYTFSKDSLEAQRVFNVFCPNSDCEDRYAFFE